MCIAANAETSIMRNQGVRAVGDSLGLACPFLQV